jgi:hypothetical protein
MTTKLNYTILYKKTVRSCRATNLSNCFYLIYDFYASIGCPNAENR